MPWISVDEAARRLDLTPASFIRTYLDLDPDARRHDGSALPVQTESGFVTVDVDAVERVRLGLSTEELPPACQALERGLELHVKLNGITGEWDEHLQTRGALIGARRGTSTQWRRYGIEFHTVALKTDWVTALLSDPRVMATPEVEFIRAHLPTDYEHLRRTAYDLPSVKPISTVTPLEDPQHPRRTTRYVGLGAPFRGVIAAALERAPSLAHRIYSTGGQA